MPQDQTKPLTPAKLKADKDTVAALATITGYDAGNEPDVELAALQALVMQADQDDAEEVRTRKAWEAARDKKVATQWKLHNGALRVKEKVVGQFGGSSDEAQTIGLKKKSERKKPGRKVKPAKA